MLRWICIWTAEILCTGSDSLYVGQLSHAWVLLFRVSYENITMINEYVIVPIVLDESILKNCLDEYVLNLEKLSAKIMPRNIVIESIIKTANNK